LDGKIDGKIETARTAWIADMQAHVAETEGKVRKDVGEHAEDEKVKWEARWTEAEARHKMELELVKEEAAKALAAAKGRKTIFLFFFVRFYLINIYLSANSSEFTKSFC
jgi:hypothetical protein